mmetsp:Transcript_25663/g.55196  ORF Transcript_25663/g.55196 Transcript_25663/m.55196 type:complete len:100 (-) Transcript_25663:251-550(-)
MTFNTTATAKRQNPSSNTSSTKKLRHPQYQQQEHIHPNRKPFASAIHSNATCTEIYTIPLQLQIQIKQSSLLRTRTNYCIVSHLPRNTISRMRSNEAGI